MYEKYCENQIIFYLVLHLFGVYIELIFSRFLKKKDREWHMKYWAIHEIVQ